MHHGRIGGPTGVALSRLVLGLGRFQYPRHERCFELLDLAFEQGIDTFDTAHLYFHGDAERILGEWLRTRSIRDRVSVITKGGHDYFGTPRLDPRCIHNDLDDSLSRLRTDHVELFLLHRDDPSVPVDELMDALDREHRAGRARTVGVSNWSVERIIAGNRHADERGQTRVVICSNQYSLAPMDNIWDGCLSFTGQEGEIERLTRLDIALLAWSALGGTAQASSMHPAFAAVLADIAGELDVSPAVLSLAYLFQQSAPDQNLFAVFSTETREHLLEDVGAVSLIVAPEMCARLRAACRAVTEEDTR